MQSANWQSLRTQPDIIYPRYTAAEFTNTHACMPFICKMHMHMLIHLQSCGLGALCSCQETANTSFRRNVLVDKFAEWCSLPSYLEYIVLTSWKGRRGRPSSMNTFKCRFLGIVRYEPCVYNTRIRPAAAGWRLRAGAMNHVRKYLCACAEWTLTKYSSLPSFPETERIPQLNI